jgi:hypothetical protein
MKMGLPLKNKTYNSTDTPRNHLQYNRKSASGYETVKTTALLMSFHTFRIAGLFVFVFYGLSIGVLSPIFAYSAGVGDFLVGISAIPIAYLLIRKVKYSRVLAIIWNGFGLLDFALAYAFGISYPTPGGTLLTFPWVIIPAGVVPIYIIIHGIILYRLTHFHSSKNCR